MNAPSAACCDDEDDEDGEAADMEGIDQCLSVVLDVLPDRPSHSAVFSEYEESGLLETDEVRSQRCLTSAVIRPTPA